MLRPTDTNKRQAGGCLSFGGGLLVPALLPLLLGASSSAAMLCGCTAACFCFVLLELVSCKLLHRCCQYLVVKYRYFVYSQYFRVLQCEYCKFSQYFGVRYWILPVLHVFRGLIIPPVSTCTKLQLLLGERSSAFLGRIFELLPC